MPQYAVLSRAAHAGTRWHRPTSYAFAGSDTLLRLGADEVLTAAAQMPIVFAEQDGQLTVFVLAGLAPGQSLLVAADGRWLAEYVPAVLRVYPFALAGAPGDPEPRPLCFDMGSGLVSTDAHAEVLIDSDGAPGPLVQRALSMLQAIDQGQAKARELTAALKAHDVLAPWRLTVDSPTGKREVDGLWLADPARIESLPDAAVLELHRSGALALAVAHCVSRGRLNLLAKLASEQATAGAPPPPLPVTDQGDLDIEFLSRGGTLSLGGLS